MTFWLSSLKAKIVWVIITSQLITLLIGFVVVAVLSHINNKQLLIENSLVQAKLIALNAVVPLTFEDQGAVEEILSRVEISGLNSIVVYDGQKNVFADYHHFKTEEGEKGDSELNLDYGASADADWLHIFVPIGEQLKPLGNVYLKISLDNLKSASLKVSLILFGLAMLLLIICYMVAMRLQRYISKPILELALTSVEVSQTKDYNIRATQYGDDEIGQLTQNFNQMLEAISARERERDTAETALNDSKTQLESAVKELQYLANYDALTQLPNRNLCMDRLRTVLLSASRKKTKVALVMLDLDHFKDINDSLGHSVGDELLKAVARRLKSVTSEQDSLARIGGDEFVIIIENFVDNYRLLTLVKQMTDSFERHFDLEGCFVHTGVSVGICVYPNDGLDVNALMKNADAAMYKAKEIGRNTFQFYEPEMNARILRRINLSNDLRLAADKNELHLVYQPKYNTKTRKIVGVEALLRWEHSVIGPISPVEFIPIAENTGLINQIGLWVVRQACKTGVYYLDEGLHKFTIAINLSAVQFKQMNLPELIIDITEQTGFPAKMLELELTESVIMTDVEQSIKMLTRLKSKGFSIAIDDFGTGYSSLSYLRRFPLDSLKIDRTFIDEVTVNEDDTAITLAILSMAKALKLKVVAEGVESNDQYEFLAKNECDEIQGFVFSPGVDKEELKALIAENHSQEQLMDQP